MSTKPPTEETNNDAPEFFVTHLQGAADQGPCVQLSFGKFVVDYPNNTRHYSTAVRVTIPADSLAAALQFLVQRQAMSEKAATAAPMPPLAQ